jgi:hypothetical protein
VSEKTQSLGVMLRENTVKLLINALKESVEEVIKCVLILSEVIIVVVVKDIK